MANSRAIIFAISCLSATFLQAAARQRTILAYRTGQSCTLRDQIEDIEALRAQIGAERMDLLGHSWGGFLVMACAAKYPQHIERLLIVDSAAPK